MASISRARMCTLVAAASFVPRRIRAQTAAPIRLAAEPNETYGEFLYGTESGIFRRAGLDVQMTLLPSAGAIATAVAGGALDVGLTDALVLANAFDRGVPLVAIAGSGFFRTTDPSSALCVAKTSAVRSAKDFEGRTIALGTLVSLTSISIKMWLRRNGADVGNVRFVEMPFSEMPAALQRGTVDGAYITEPQLSQQSAELRIVAIPYGAIADRFLISLVVSTRAWVAQNGETARRLVAAIYETARWANRNRDLTAPILAKYSKLEPEVIRHMRRTLFATTLQPGLVQPVLDAAFTYKALERQTSAVEMMVHV
jgi:NitT/TauT family transport system substrate-binding protein